MQEINIEHTTPQINIDTATRNYHLPIASETQLGGIKVGNNLTIEEDGTLNAESTEYNLPVATSSTLGGVKIGTGLSMAVDTLNVTVDNSLSSTSSNPVQNSVISSNISTLTSAIQAVGTEVTNLASNYTNLSGTVSNHTTSITALESTVSTQSTAIQTNTSNISNNTAAIANTNSTVSTLSGRMDTAEDNITDISSNVSTLSETIDTLADVDDTEVTYSYLLPVSTWSSGSIMLSRRGVIVNAYFNLEGSLTLASGNSTLLYTLADHLPAVTAYGTLISDDGVLSVSVNTTGEITLSNISSHNINLSKLQGCLTYTLSFSD